MKKTKLVILLAVLAVVSCKKKDEILTPTPDPTPPLATVSAVPGSFTQKVLIEECTGNWCGYCVDGAYRVEQIVNKNAGKTIAVAVHQGDAMDVIYNTLKSTFANTYGFPAGMVARIPAAGEQWMDRGSWDASATNVLNKTASCGLAIEGVKLSGNTATINIHAGFNQNLTGTYNVTIYLVENNVSGVGSSYDQHNYLSKDGSAPDPSSPYYNQPTLITGYKHMNVVRKALTAVLGDAIPSNKLISGGEYVITKSVDISAYKVGDLKIVAFINKVDADSKKHEVMNVQEASFYTGQLTGKNWD